MYGFFNFYIQVQVRQAGTQCPLLGYFTAVLTHGQTSPPAKEYWEKKKLQRIKNNCMHRQLGQIMSNKIEKDQKTNYCFWGSGSNNTASAHDPCTWHHQGLGGPPQPPFWPNPWTCPHPRLIWGTHSPPLREQAREVVTCFCCVLLQPKSQ